MTNRAKIKGLFEGQPPYDPKELEKAAPVKHPINEQYLKVNIHSRMLSKAVKLIAEKAIAEQLEAQHSWAKRAADWADKVWQSNQK